MKSIKLMLVALTLSVVVTAQETINIWSSSPNDIEDAEYKEEVFYNKNNAPSFA